MSTTTTRTTTTGFGWCAPESEQAPYFSLRSVERAYRSCRRRKRVTVRACLYEQKLLDNLVDTRDALLARTWQPVPPVVFCLRKPKACEVYAAQFQDRVVHHLLVEQLDELLDRKFIFDAASNRKGKGTHFAADRLQHFMRQMQGQGWLLQLDIANFFNSINRQILLELLEGHLRRAVKQDAMPLQQARDCYALSKRIIRQPLTEQAIRLDSEQSFDCIPPHKRLGAGPPDTGLPIGNLTSQLFRHDRTGLELTPVPMRALPVMRAQHYRDHKAFVLITEQGYLRGGMKRRVVRQLWWPERSVTGKSRFNPNDPPYWQWLSSLYRTDEEGK